MQEILRQRGEVRGTLLDLAFICEEIEETKVESPFRSDHVTTTFSCNIQAEVRASTKKIFL